MKIWNSKVESIVFFLFTLLNLLPVILVKYVVSLDGPQHLYVSNVVDQLWKHQELYQQFFVFNDFIIGNCTGNYILAVINLFLPDWMAEKVLIILYLFGMAYSFRFLVKSITGKISLLIYLVFPFSYTSLFMFGYYNFSIAIAVAMFAFGYWIRIHDKITPVRILVFTLLQLLMYYSHVFVFSLFLMALAVFFIYSAIFKFIDRKKEEPVFMKLILKGIILVISALPALVIGYIYMKAASTEVLIQYLKSKELWSALYNMKILIGFVPTEEIPITHYFSLFFCLLIITQLVMRFLRLRALKTSGESNKHFLERNDFWFLLTAFFLVLYFVFPDRLSAGNIATRITIFMIMSFLVWLSVQEFPIFLNILFLGVIVLLSFQIQKIHYGYRAAASTTISELKEVETFLPENAVYLSWNRSDNWLFYHFQSYIGSDKRVIDLKSGGCSDQFAVNWNTKSRPFTFLGCKDAGAITQNNYNKRKSQATVKGDYIVVLGNYPFSEADSNNIVFECMEDGFKAVFTTSKKFATVYKFARDPEYVQIESEFRSNPRIVETFKQKSNYLGIPVSEVFRREILWDLCSRPWQK
jgi:hypothetical protein